jgi:hypothetical protein
MGGFKVPKIKNPFKDIGKNPLATANSFLGDLAGTADDLVTGGFNGLSNMFGMNRPFGGQPQGPVTNELAKRKNRLSEGFLSLDRESKAEITPLLQAGNFADAEKIFLGAQAGTSPKYAARIASQHAYDIMVDKPGAKQTRDNGIGSLLMGNQYRGR